MHRFALSRRACLGQLGLALFAGCSSKSGSGSGSGFSGHDTVTVDGSSTVFPVTEAVAEDYMQANPGAKVTVGISGTGGGFKKFVRGELDVADASRPILEQELKDAKTHGIEFIELPICFDALTVAVNPQATWVDSMTVGELKKVWEPDAQGKVETWNQIRPEWPAEKLSLFGAGSDSGTFDYFTEAICGKAKASRGDYTASEDDNTLVQGVEGNKFALGYIPYSYYESNKQKMKALGVDWEKGQGPVKPSMEAVVEGKYNPLSRPLFIYVNKKSIVDRPLVRGFVEFYLKHVKELAAQVSYLPLPDAAYQICMTRLSTLQSGSAFGGVPEVGLHIDDLMKREPKQ